MTNTLWIWTFQCNCPYISHFYEELPNIIATKHQIICDQSQIWIHCNKCTKFIEHSINRLRIWTFHCNCPYISHLRKELPDITATKHQMNSNQSEIWFSAIYTPNLLSVWQILFESEHFIAIVPISLILMKNYQISLQLNFKWILIGQKLDSVQYMHQIYSAFDKYTSNLNISLQLSLQSVIPWRITNYHCN